MSCPSDQGEEILRQDIGELRSHRRYLRVPGIDLRNVREAGISLLT
jgi:hypothetical protein